MSVNLDNYNGIKMLIKQSGLEIRAAKFFRSNGSRTKITQEIIYISEGKSSTKQ